MSGRRRQALAPSLFPFLAVLVCTLGTLILLLALVAQNATDAAEQSAAAREREASSENEPSLPAPRLAAATVSSMIQEEQFRVEQLVAVRDQQTADVEQKRDQLTHLEDHISRLQQQLQRLSDEVKRATGDIPTNVIDQTALEQLKEKIEQQQAILSELRADADRQTPRIVIVPHKGPNGTARRPIYIECTRDGVTIWPEGSTISTSQLADAFATANPLDGALRAIRYYVTQRYGDNTPPYPLLVVRPDGIESYAAARGAMRDWDDQFGYELIPAEVKLAFPEPDSQLKQRIDLAIRQAAIQQHARHAIADRSGQSRKRLPTLSAASLDRQGRAGGFRSHRDGWAALPGQRGTSPNYASGGNQLATGGGSDSPAISSPALRELDEHLRGAADEMRRREADASGNGAAAATAGPSHDTPGPSHDTPGTSHDTPGPSHDTPGTSHDDAAAGGGTLFTQLPNNTQFPNNTQLPNNTDSLVQESSGAERSQQPNDASGEKAYGKPEAAEQDSAEFDATDRTSAPAASSPSQLRTGEETAGGDSRRGSSLSVDTQMAPPAANGQSSQSAPMGAMNQAPQLSRNPPTSIQSPSSNPPRSSRNLVRRRGRDWALPKSMLGAHGNEIVRTIRVQCFEDRFVLLPPASGGAIELFGFSDGQVDRATLELATAVRDRVERWGAAIPGGRWQPRLEVEVMPHGQARFHQLQTLFQGSGVEVQGRKTQ